MTVNLKDIRVELERVLTSAAITLNRAFNEACLAGGMSTSLKISTTGLPDFVTRTDVQIEENIKFELEQKFPNIPFVGEESGGNTNASEYFLVDPLDGTSNFAALRKYFAISAAYVRDGEVMVAAIADSLSGKVVTAIKGEGAYISDKRLELTAPDEFTGAKVFQLDIEYGFTNPENFDRVTKVLPQFSGMRKEGSTVADLFAIVANGRKSVLLADGLKPHDLAAGFLIIQESGGVVCRPDGTPANFQDSDIIAGHPKLVRKITQLLSPSCQP